MALSILVYRIFRSMKQSFLIQSSSIISWIISVVLFLCWPLESLHKRNDLYCNGQALLLNYCFISTHAHFSFVMLNNLMTAMGWKFMGIKDSSALVGLMFFVSISTPMVPTIIILAMNLDPSLLSDPTAQIFTKRYFFCVVNEPALLGYRLWFLLFSVPGVIAACILFFKTIESRRKVLKLSSTSQFSKTQLARMFLAIITYVVLSVLGIVLGFAGPDDPDMIHVSDFLPAGVGFIIFITYGVGSTAREYYKKLYLRLGEYFGIEFKDRNLLRKSSESSIVTNRRQSSIKSTETRSRRPSQLSESIDETFIYDLPVTPKNEELERKSVPRHMLRRNPMRRTSEPQNRRGIPPKKQIENIPEVDEELCEEEIDEVVIERERDLL